ncbi:hypothetical protein NLQ74_25420, partial [Escherichia coli]|nr:hypothetical protein [Escherichia coli]
EQRIGIADRRVGHANDGRVVFLFGQWRQRLLGRIHGSDSQYCFVLLTMRLPIEYWPSFALLRDYTDQFCVFNGAILLRTNDLRLLHFFPVCVNVGKSPLQRWRRTAGRCLSVQGHAL